MLDVLAQKAVPMCALVRRPPSAAVTSASAACATCALCGRCGGADSRQHCRVPPWQRKRPTTRPATPVPNGHCYPYMQLSGAAAAIEVALMVRQDLPISASVFCSIHPVTPAAAVEVVLHGQRASESAYHGLIRGVSVSSGLDSGCKSSNPLSYCLSAAAGPSLAPPSSSDGPASGSGTNLGL